MRLIDTLLINRIPCTRDPKYDMKESVLGFSTLVMNSRHRPHDSVYALASLYREMPVPIFCFQMFLFVVVIIIVVDDNVVVVFFLDKFISGNTSV